MDAALIELAKENEAKEFIARKAAINKSKAKAVGTVTIPNDNKLNITTGVKQLQEIQEKSMANELDVTEVDRAKYDKIEKLKKRDEDVAAAIAIAADLKGDIQKIKEELCVGENCLKNQVTNKFGEMNNKFGEIDEKIKKIEEKTSGFVCENCGYASVPALSSFCPQCGSPIYEWSDDSGDPVKGWRHWTGTGEGLQ